MNVVPINRRQPDKPSRMRNRRSAPGKTNERDELLEEVRQLRAALAIYRHLVDRLLARRMDGREPCAIPVLLSSNN